MKQCFVIIFSLATILVNAQNGTLRGQLLDKESGETMIGANVIVDGTSTGTASDLDGNYNLSLEPGTYTIVFSFITYATQKVTDVVIKSGEVTVLNVQMGIESEKIQEVIVEAKAIRNTETAILSMQKKSVNVLDGISAQSFKKTGDGDAAAAMKRVTGVSVEDGKYVYVRGLGDRYTKTTLNGMDVPGLDPDRNTIQMDVFPTSLIDNIVVYKTFSPDLSGDFTGGMVSVFTKDFPDQKTLSISGSVGYNPDMHFNSDFRTYESQGLDELALGAGLRNLPFDKTTNIPLPIEGSTELENLMKEFDGEMSVDKKTSLMDYAFNLSTGNQINTGKHSIGYNAVLGYSKSYTYYDELIFNEYIKDRDVSNTELVSLQDESGTMGQEEVLWSALLNGSIKKQNNRLSLSLFHTQNGMKQAAELRSIASTISPNPGAILEKDVLYYNQRSITNMILVEKFSAPEKQLEIELKISPSYATNKEPDLRQTFFAVEDNDNYSLNIGDGAKVSRVFRDLSELGASNRLDVTWKFMQGKLGIRSKVKAGLAYNIKNRNFEVLRYEFRDIISRFNYSGDPNELFQSENLFDATTGTGVVASAEIAPSNSYNSRLNIAAIYLMNELNITTALKAIYGVRAEYTLMNYTGESQNGERSYNNTNVLEQIDPLPSLGLIYALNEDMNLRLNGSRTIARPSFKEKSVAQIFDAVTGRTFIGNLDLLATNITNADMRWEYFFKKGEMVSVSGFYKHFQDPIEVVVFQKESPDNFTPRNVDQAQVYGAEIEFRKDFAFLSESLKGLTMGANASIIESQVRMNIDEYEGRLEQARTGEVISDTRQMQGQSPFLINGFVNYNRVDLGLEANVSYNVQGKRLAIVGIAQIPDVYEVPFHSLNAKISKSIGESKRWNASLLVTNLLDQDRVLQQESYKASAQIFEKRSPGQAFKFGLSYNIR